tara:strand:+ start:925 stop:3219 length:2295 start_codon:yes stop_codon:yes gene_type:complete
MSSNFWKIINGHTWSKERYDLAVKYLSSSKMDWPETWNNTNKSTFRNRVKPYIVKDGKLVLETEDNSLSMQADAKYLFEVIVEEDIEKVLTRIMEHEKDLSMSPTNLYKKLRQKRMIGISRQRVDDFLKSYPALRQLKAVAKETVVKSYRPNYPMQHWQIDLIDFNNNKDRGYRYIVVIIDIFSKFIYLHPIKDKTGPSVNMVLRKIFLNGDIPRIIGCDQGSEFSNESLNVLLSEFNVKLVVSAPYRPQTQGFVENKNRQIKAYIALHSNKYNNTRQWYDILDSVAFSINNTEHSVTKLTPMEVHRGRNVPVKVIQDKNLEEHYKHEKVEDFDKMFNNSQYHQDFQIAERTLYEERVNIVRTRIHNEATKRESKQKNVNIRLGNYVKLGTYIETKSKQVKPIQIKVSLEKGERMIKNPIGLKGIASQTHISKIAKILKWDWRSDVIRNSIFYVYSEKRDKNNQHPKLLLRVNNKDGAKVSRLTNLKGVETWTEEFHRNELLFVDNRDLGHGIDKKRPDYNPYILNQRIVCDLKPEQGNRNSGTVTKPNQNVSGQLENDVTFTTKTVNPTYKQLYQFMNPFEINILKENFAVRFKRFPDKFYIITEWRSLNPPWVLKNSNNEEFYDELDVKYYNTDDIESSWCFVEIRTNTRRKTYDANAAELNVQNYELSSETLTKHMKTLTKGGRTKTQKTRVTAEIALFRNNSGIPDYATAFKDNTTFVATIMGEKEKISIVKEGYGKFKVIDGKYGWIFLNEINPIKKII